jgi:uncharacterized protein (TIGR03032 family)
MKSEIKKIQNQALRDPVGIFGTAFSNAGIQKESLKYKSSGDFEAILAESGISLYVTREYEHLILALSSDGKELEQSFFHLPHPSGLAIDKEKGVLFVASTRNPNQIWEFHTVSGYYERKEDKNTLEKLKKLFFPTRSKVYPGSWYLHDLNFLGGALYANSVGRNAVFRVDMNSPAHEKALWWPKCIEKNAVADFSSNHIQLNSISGGNNPEEAFYTASTDRVTYRKPGHKNFRVDKKGVLLDGRSREAIVSGLTRPHSARLIKEKIWLNNSGYGETGFIENNVFKPVVKSQAWTRGLCQYGDYLFIGLSKVLPAYAHYAPGLKKNSDTCGIIVMDIRNSQIVGSLVWPFGNQIFSIDWISRNKAEGFLYKEARPSTAQEKSAFYRFKN